MAGLTQGAVLHHLGQLFGRGTVTGLSEWQLLTRYLDERDETAFEALVARHGPMVLGVCRRLLADPNDVDDAFQATFLVLVRRASSLSERDAIGHWLYGVAQRVALRVRSEAARRRFREPNVAASQHQVATVPSADVFDLGPVLDEELSRLPGKYRAPLVLCYLEGFSHEEAAQSLQWPIGTVKGRLVRARELLKGRLVRRGVGLSVALAALPTASRAATVVPDNLRASTVATAMKVAAGPITAGMLSASVAALVEGVLTTMLWTNLRMAAAALLVMGILAGSAGVIAQQAAQEPTDAPPRVEIPVVPAPVSSASAEQAPSNDPARSNSEAEARVVPNEFPNPDPKTSSESSLRRLASTIFQDELRTYDNDDANGTKFNNLIRWSKAILDASGDQPAERAAAVEAHLARVLALRDAVSRVESRESKPQLQRQVAYYQREAAEMLARAQGDGENPRPRREEGLDPVADDDPLSKSILAKLEEPISMSFANETPLEDVLKYIKQATTGANDTGIPIYVDPVGLQEAEKTMTSPVSLDLERVPLRITLRLLLKQLGLSYTVRDGLLTITNEGSAEDSPLSLLEDKAERGELSQEETKKLLEMLKTLNEIKRLKAEGKALEHPPTNSEKGQNKAASQ